MSLPDYIKKIFIMCYDALREDGTAIHHIRHYPPKTIWDRLTAEGDHALIDMLRRVERKDPGYTTVILPDGGWSTQQSTNNAILQWLQEQHINVWSPAQEILELEGALS